MRDRQAVYAATPPSDLAAQWRFAAIVCALGAWTSWILWPESTALGVGLLVGAVAVGVAWAWILPPRPREPGDQPWLLAAATAAVLLTVSATWTGPYVLALACVALGCYLAASALGVARHHRRHATPAAR